MIKAMMMAAATPARIHGTTSVRVCSCCSVSLVPGLAGPVPAGFETSVVGSAVGVAVEGPEGLLGSGDGVVVAATLPCAPPAALAATAVESMDGEEGQSKGGHG